MENPCPDSWPRQSIEGPLLDPAGKWALLGYTGKGDAARFVEVRDGKVVRTLPVEKGVNFAGATDLQPNWDIVSPTSSAAAASCSQWAAERGRRNDARSWMASNRRPMTAMPSTSSSSARTGTSCCVPRSAEKWNQAWQELRRLQCGREGRQYDQVFKGTLSFQAGGRLGYTARDGRRLVRVTHSPKTP